MSIFKAIGTLIIALLNSVFYILISQVLAPQMYDFSVLILVLGMTVSAILLNQFSNYVSQSLSEGE